MSCAIDLWSVPGLVIGAAGRLIALAFLLLFAVRLVQNFRWEMVDPDEEIVHPRAEPHAQAGLLLQVVKSHLNGQRISEQSETKAEE